MTQPTQALSVAPKKEVAKLADVDKDYLGQLYLMFRDPTLPADAPRQPTKHELAIFAQYCAANSLDPLGKDIYFIKDKKGKVHYQISIDGLRGRSESSGELMGRVGPQWIDRQGNWHDHWIQDEPPAGCRVGILRKGFSEPVWGFARFASYCQSREAWSNWGKMPEVMIAKCAEAQAHRAAFPKNCARLYVPEEMMEVVEGTVVEELPTNQRTKKFGSPVVTPELPASASVQDTATESVAVEATDEEKAAALKRIQTTMAGTPTVEAATDEEFDQIRRASNLFGGRVIEKVRHAVEEMAESVEEFAPENDDEAATDKAWEEAWKAWVKKYGREQPSRDKMVSIGVKLHNPVPTNKDVRLVWEHLNSLTNTQPAF